MRPGAQLSRFACAKIRSNTLTGPTSWHTLFGMDERPVSPASKPRRSRRGTPVAKGLQFHCWRVVGDVARTDLVPGKEYWACFCECGTFRNVQSDNLRLGYSKSCGCRGKFGRRLSAGKGKPLPVVMHGYWSQVRNGAKARGLDVTVTALEIQNLLISQNERCALSGLKLNLNILAHEGVTASLDRINSDLGYIPGNIQWVHRHINRMKWDYPQDYFIRLCELVAGEATVRVNKGLTAVSDEVTVPACPRGESPAGLSKESAANRA